MKAHLPLKKKSLIAQLQKWWSQHQKEVVVFILAFICWRVTLFGVSVLADNYLPYAPQFPYAEVLLPAYHLPRWLYSWANFDGVHYLTIAEKGYVGTGLIQAFFPLFPYVILHTVFLATNHHLNTLIFGLVLSNVFACAMLLSWYFFIQDVYDRKTAVFSSIALLFFPTAFFWGTLYTESLFMLLVIWTFWLSFHRKWFGVMLCILLASATRIVGIFLLPAIWIEIFCSSPLLTSRQSLREAPVIIFQVLKSNWQKFLLVSLGSLGLLGYMHFLQGEFHDPLYFAHVQSSFGAGRESHLLLYPQVVWRSLKILIVARPFNWRYLTYIQEFFAGVVGGVLLVFTIKQVRFSYWFFAVAAFLLPTMTGTFSSMSRYILVCFPLYILFAKLTQKSSVAGWLLVGFSSILLVVNTLLFIQGYWVG